MKQKNYDRKIQKPVRLDKIHWDIIEGLTPFYGSNDAEVVRNIVLMWIHENIGSPTIEKLKELKAIKLNRNREVKF